VGISRLLKGTPRAVPDRCEDIKVQELDSKLEATKYEIKARIIEMAAATPF
jgi:hypothetical protein